MRLPFGLKAARKALRQGRGFRAAIAGLEQDRIAVDPFAAQGRLMAMLSLRSPLVFDVGAHDGHSVEKFKRALAGCRIVSFEPTPRAFQLLRQAWGGDPAVELVNKAVVRSDGPVEFHLNAYDAASSTLARPAAGRRYYPSVATTESTIAVEGVSLDSFIGDGEVPDILKMDIQGGELAALEGAQAALTSGKLKLIYTESMFVPHYDDQPLLRDLWNYLSDRGFTLYNIYNLHVATNGQLRYGDALFVSDEVRRRGIDAMAEEP